MSVLHISREVRVMDRLFRQNFLKLPNDFFDTIQDELERVEYRATLDPGASFTELYRDLKIRLHVHLTGLAHSQFGK